MVSSKWFFFLVALQGLVMSPGEVAYPSPFPQEKEADYWYKLAKDDIYEALHRPRNEKVAKNVILFLGDGLGITVGTASRILKGQRQGYSGEEGYLLWERFPNIGLIKTYNIDKQVSDSAGTATAYLTGVKGNYRTLGVNGNVEEDDCAGSLKPENRLDSILKWAQDAGKDTGLVTTAQVTHASPAGLYAKTPSRYWQCDTKMAKAGEHTRACKDIARQLVEDEPGRNINVIFGGGRQELGAPTLAKAKDKCHRSDGRDLVEEWVAAKKEQGKTAAYVTSAGMLRDLEVQDVDYIMGLFGEIHLPYEIDEEEDAPSLAQMVQAAIRRLSRNKEGFFLMVTSFGFVVGIIIAFSYVHPCLCVIVAMSLSVPVCLCVIVAMSLSVPVCLCVIVAMSLSVPVCLCVIVAMSLSVPVCLCVIVAMSLSVPVCLCVIVAMSLSVPVCLCVIVAMSLSVPVCLCVIVAMSLSVPFLTSIVNRNERERECLTVHLSFYFFTLLGVVENNPDVTDGMPYTTLMFTTGHGFNYTWDGEKVMRRNLTGVDTKDKEFEPLAAVPTLFGEETHGGEDVAAFAVGPMAHLFHRIHEQTYVAHVMAYSSCVGPYSYCDRPKQHNHDEEEKGTGEQAGEHEHGEEHNHAEHVGSNHGMNEEDEHAEHSEEHGAEHSESTKTESAESEHEEHSGEHEHGEEHNHAEHVGCNHGMKEEDEHAEHSEEHGDEHSESTKTEHAESEHEEHRPAGEYDHAKDHATDHDHHEHHIVEIVPLEQENDPENENIPQEEEEEDEEGEKSKNKAKDEENEESDEENETGGGKNQVKATENEDDDENEVKEEEEEEEAEEAEKTPSYIMNKIKAPRERGAASSIILNYVLFLLTTFSAIWMVG
ncbi:uncharacterized protein LOC134772650 [Penaeus indicus]|uniref:uncharacterized protein LOC134772650 n=1 Tax=Penaeus indicus TaxID=29960 RepID=UPI00300D2A0F